ncbi:MAG TPA: hypothetical protein VHL80_21665 [Polyangia bacterium]|nr:hypothetical protein [Polyangia bacterium]
MADAKLTGPGLGRLTRVVLVAALGAVACGPRSTPPARSPAAASQSWDGGPPLPPTSAKKGLIVPADLGLGQGPSGPASTSGTTPAESPVLGAPNVGN